MLLLESIDDRSAGPDAPDRNSIRASGVPGKSPGGPRNRYRRLGGLRWQPGQHLVIGEPAAVTRVLTVAWLNLRRPVVWSDQAPLRLPPEPVGTFILWRADDLSLTDQRRLLCWDRRQPVGACDHQIVSRPVFTGSQGSVCRGSLLPSEYRADDGTRSRVNGLGRVGLRQTAASC